VAVAFVGAFSLTKRHAHQRIQPRGHEFAEALTETVNRRRQTLVCLGPFSDPQAALLGLAMHPKFMR
jgi:hypothetical protein